MATDQDSSPGGQIIKFFDLPPAIAAAIVDKSDPPPDRPRVPDTTEVASARRGQGERGESRGQGQRQGAAPAAAGSKQTDRPAGFIAQTGQVQGESTISSPTTMPPTVGY